MKSTIKIIIAVLLLSTGFIVTCSNDESSDNKAAIDNPPEKAWEEATLVVFDNPGLLYSPQIAFDGLGNAFAVWQQSDGTRYNVWANRYIPEIGWITATLIETNNAGSVSDSKVACDNFGNALVVWSQSDGTRSNIWANRYIRGIGWDTAHLIEFNDAGSASNPQIVINNEGDAFVIWIQSDGTRDNVWASRFIAGWGWATTVLIETDDAGPASSPHVACDDAGNAIAVWSQSDGTRKNIWANRYTAGSGWGVAALIETENAGDAFNPRVAVDGNGNAIAVWSQSDGIRDNLWANRYTANIGWSTATLIETENLGNASSPQIACDNAGNAIAIWYQRNPIEHVWANRYTVGSGWGTAALLETDDTHPAMNPQIVMDREGNAIVTWMQNDGAWCNIVANRYVYNNGWDNPTPIENINKTFDVPQIAIDQEGNIIVIWWEWGVMLNRIWANIFR